jgi:hypothetical protein
MVQAADATYILNVLQGVVPLCEDACDADDDGSISESDSTRVLNYLFLAGAPPPPPFPGCGLDPTADSLGCNTPPNTCNP